MQEARKRQDDNWVRCGKCGHKLFKVNPQSHVLILSDSAEDTEGWTIEIKCHSCKTINKIKKG